MDFIRANVDRNHANAYRIRVKTRRIRADMERFHANMDDTLFFELLYMKMNFTCTYMDWIL